MPKKQNYSFERSQRAKSKATKKAERLQAKADKVEARKSDTGKTETKEGHE